MRSPTGAGSRRFRANSSALAELVTANKSRALAPQRQVFNRLDRIWIPFEVTPFESRRGELLFELQTVHGNGRPAARAMSSSRIVVTHCLSWSERSRGWGRRPATAEPVRT